MGQQVVQFMARFNGNDVSSDRPAEQGQVTDDIEDLMADQFVVTAGNRQTRRLIIDDDVFDGPPFAEA